MLPSFDRPPVVEVALGIEFVPVPGLGPVELVRLRDRWQGEYPGVQVHPVLPPSAPPRGALLSSFGLQFSFSPTPPVRMWMFGADGRMLLQAQHDRLFLNWRRLDPVGGDYPSYDALRPEFLGRWTDFVQFVSEIEAGDLVPAVAEVTFVNAIVSESNDLAAILTTQARAVLPGTLLESRVTYVADVSGTRDSPAELRIDAGPAPDGDGLSLIVNTRVSLPRGADDVTSIRSALDHAHAVGVEGFSQVTTASMHEVWGRTR